MINFLRKFNSEMLRTVIIDDEDHIRETLTTLLADYCPQVKVVGEAESVASGIKVIRSNIERPESVPDQKLVLSRALVYQHFLRAFLGNLEIEEECKDLQLALLQAGFKEDEVDKLKIYKPVGCADCNGGYRGRSGVFEVMPISDNIARIILEEGNSMRIAQQAREEGINDLRRSALNTVAEGITDLVETNRVTKD